MSEDFKIQCESCGTYYHDIEEVCPYCGTPQPHGTANVGPIVVEPPQPEPLIEDAYPPSLDEGGSIDDYVGDEHPYDDDAYDDEAFLDDDPNLYHDEQPFDDEDIFAVAGEGEYLPETYEEEAYDDEAYDDEAYDEEAYDEDEYFADPYEDETYLDDEYEDDQAYLTDDGTETQLLDPYRSATTVLGPPYLLSPGDDYIADEELEEEAAPKPRGYKRRIALGCFSLMICITTYYGGLGLLGVYHGWQERSNEVQAEAEDHLQRGQEFLASGAAERASAEFEQALRLNPNLIAAREALREAEILVRALPTPTSQARTAVAGQLMEQAQAAIDAEDWDGAAEALSEVRAIDPDYRPDEVADLAFDIEVQRARSLIEPDTIVEALTAFDAALAERPNDTDVQLERAQALLYVAGTEAAALGDYETAVDAFRELQRDDPDYLDVSERLVSAFERFGDEYSIEDEWCLARVQYQGALRIAPGDSLLREKLQQSSDECRNGGSSGDDDATATPTRQPASSVATPDTPQISSRTALTATLTPTATETITETVALAPLSGSIFYATYNPNETRNDVLIVPVTGGGEPQIVVADASLPDISLDGRYLTYRSDAIESEGLHVLDLATGEDRRITIFQQDILPKWGGNDSTRFLFTALEPGSDRWIVQVGFTDGKSEAQILLDGRTPDLSPDGALIAYQGTNAAGNDPGIYLSPAGGGELRRLTSHESDRSPVFSPDGSKIAYMSTMGGNWDIYVIDVAGGEPQQVTDYGGNDGLPAWSPDGGYVAYVSDQRSSWNIYTVPISGGTPNRVTAWDGEQRADWLIGQISWSP